MYQFDSDTDCSGCVAQYLCSLYVSHYPAPLNSPNCVRLFQPFISRPFRMKGFFAAQTYALFDRLTIVLFIVSALGMATPIISLVSLYAT